MLTDLATRPMSWTVPENPSKGSSIYDVTGLKDLATTVYVRVDTKNRDNGSKVILNYATSFMDDP